MGKLVLMLGGPGSGKSKKLREMFLEHKGSARFLECRHKPESISHVFQNHPSDKSVEYLDNPEEIAGKLSTNDAAVYIDAPQLTVNELLALVTLSQAYDLEIYAPLRLTIDGHHPFLNHKDSLTSVEYITLE